MYLTARPVFAALACAACLPVLALAQSDSTPPAAPKVVFPQPSPAASITQTVGLTQIAISYSRPDVRNRPVFGGIEPYGAVWRTGANAATTITFSTPVRLNGVPIPKGTYSLFTIPDPKEWTVIINKDAKQWGAFKYDQAQDLVRFKAYPQVLPASVETFTIDFSDLTDDSAWLNLSWAQTKVPIRVDVDSVARVAAQLEKSLASPGAHSAGFYLQAAQFYYDHGQRLDRALDMINHFMDAKTQYSYEGLYLKAEILARQGDFAGAAACAREAIPESIKSEGPTNVWLPRYQALLTAYGNAGQ